MKDLYQGNSLLLLTKYLGIAMNALLCTVLLLTSSVAYSNFVISLKEIPEWAPGHPLKMSRIIAGSKGVGSVVVTIENSGIPKVLHIASFRYDPNLFVNWANTYNNYQDFYGSDENNDGRIVEGNPKTVALSFYNNGKMMKSIRLSESFAHLGQPNGQLQWPATLIELVDKLSAYAKQAEPQARARYYMTAVPYSENEKYWLLKSTTVKSIPAITNLRNEADVIFLQKLIENIPNFLAIEEASFLRIKKEIALPAYQFKKTFRLSDQSDEIVDIKLFSSHAFE